MTTTIAAHSFCLQKNDCLALHLTYTLTKWKNIFCIMAVTNNIDNSVLFCQRKISGFRSFEKIKKSFKYVFLVFIIVDR